MIAFIDTEVNPQTKKVADYGAVREDGAVLHSHSKAYFDAFVSKCDTVCGLNIINHDLKYTALRGNPTIVDTLFLSPLLFPKRPYHHLVKDDKLLVDELNNPVNDSMKARDLLNDEIAAWNQLSPDRQEIYYQLLHETDQFKGFFKYIGYASTLQQSLLGRIFRGQPDWGQLILKEFEGKICSHADFETLVKQYPIELAYCLAVIGADDIFSITPAWVIRNYPKVVNVMNLLCNTSCGNCDYCHSRLDAHSGLKEFFGYDKFRTFDGIPMQQQAVESAIQGESLLTIFPTGGGKSLTFQLPALMAGRNTHGLTVVISPLQSLMKDQVDNLAARGISEAVTISGQSENMELFERLKVLRKEIADEINYPAFVVMSDKTLHALATDKPTTLEAFGNTFGIGEHKRDSYGERFVEVIRQYSPAEVEHPFKEESFIPSPQTEPKEGKKKKQKNQITIQGTAYVVDEDIWESIEWRKVLKEITERAYWNYQGPLEIHLSDYVAPDTEHRKRIVATLCRLLKDGYGMNVNEQTGVVTIAQKYDYDKDGQVVTFPSGSFFEILSRFRLFVIQNKRFPFMDGEHDEVALRKWYREVGHGLVAITDEEKVLFDNLSVEFADIPRTRAQYEKSVEVVAVQEDVVVAPKT